MSIQKVNRKSKPFLARCKNYEGKLLLILLRPIRLQRNSYFRIIQKAFFTSFSVYGQKTAKIGINGKILKQQKFD